MTEHTKIKSFDKTIATSEKWIGELRNDLGFKSMQVTFIVFKTIVNILRDRLSIEETAQFAAELPLLLRGAYYEGWKPKKSFHKIKSVGEFYNISERELKKNKVEDEDYNKITMVVLKFIAKKIAKGEIEDIKKGFPKNLQELFPEV